MKYQRSGFIPTLMFVAVFIGGMLATTHVYAQQAGTSGIDPDYPTTISNQNIWKIYSDYQIMIEEVDKSLTKSNAGMLSHDAVRWGTYIANLRAYTDYWQAHAFLDLPVTHGRDWELIDPLNPSCDFKDNTAACEFVAMLINARDELTLSASAELPMHLYPADLARQQTYWTSMEGYIQFMIDHSPLDQPVTAAEERLGLKPGFDQPSGN